MPATVGPKPPPDPPRKKASEEAKKVESVKLIEKESEPKCEPKCEPIIETPAQPSEKGETEAVKKATPKKRPSEEKKSGISVADRIPKTKAQRAKGSIALNKTLEKTDSECGGKKQASLRSIDRMSRPNTREGAGIGEVRKTAVPVRSKVKVKSEGPELKAGKKRKSWVAVVEKASSETINEKTVGVVEQESKEVKTEEIRPINTASNSCSFFEKLQQGVRAYFGSRNSFNPSLDEKNKKKVTEGGHAGSTAECTAEDSLLHGEMPTQSTVQFKASGSAPSMLCPQRLESNVWPQSESKVQIPRLASTNPKGSNLLKKRVKKNRKGDIPASPRTPGSSARIEHLRSVSSKEMAKHNLHERVLGSGTSGFSLAKRPSAHKSEPLVQEAIPDTTGGKQIHAIVENPVTCTTNKPKTEIKRKCKSKGMKKVSPSRAIDDASELLRKSTERVISRCKIGMKSPPPSDTSFETLINCISSVLGKDEGFYDLQISPVITGGGESSLESDIQILANSPASQSLQITEVVTAFEKYDDVNSSDYLSPKKSLTRKELNHEGDFGIPTESTIAKMLFGEIDLHLELENYLRDIESFSGVKNRTKNTLQCNLCDEYYPLCDSCLDLPGCATDFFEATEIKSNSTFASATSVCTQQDGDTNKPRVFLDHNHDMASISEEYFDSRNTKMFISETQFTDKVGDIRKIKSDNDPKRLLQDSKLKSSVKRTFGNTFQSSRAAEEKWALPPLQSHHSTDSYEKILPFGWDPNQNCDEVKNRSGFLQRNSLSAEMLPATVRKSASLHDRSQNCTETVENADSYETLVPPLPEESSFDQMIKKAISKMQSTQRPLWSPSMPELIEIYNSILKQNKKIKSDSRASVSRCISSHLLSFLNEELQEKECKANLVMLASDLKKKMKTPRVWKPGRQKNDNTLEKYVMMFQEILQSSLSIDQISRINNIISGLQEYSEKNYDLVKSMNVKRKKDKMKKIDFPELETMKSNSPRPKSAQEKTSPPIKPRKPLPAKKPIGSIQPPSLQGKLRQKKRESSTPKKEEEVIPMEEVTIIELTSPTELESILHSCFAAEDVGTLRRDSRDKILVTVKLRGNQVLVSKLTYFKNERSLTPNKSRENGTSQLIIENVTKDQVKAVTPKNTKSGTPRLSVKIVEPKIAKPETKTKQVLSRKVKKRAKARPAARTARKETCMERFFNSLVSKESEQHSITQPFEYDQMLLRAQHPIEAIIERSESKLSEHIESSDEDQLENRQLQTAPEKNILFADVHTKTTLKEALMGTFGESVNLKELTCDFNWNDEKTLDKSLARTKSYVINREALKRQTIAQKSLKHAETVRSMSDLTSKRRNRRKVRGKANSYMCFPSILNVQRKPTPVKKKTKKQPKQKNGFLQFSNSRTRSNAFSSLQQEEITKEFSSETHSKVSISESMSSLTYSDGTEKSPVITGAFESDEEVPENSSMELLYYESESPSPNVSPKVSASVVKTVSKTPLSEQVPLPAEEKAPNCHRPSVLTVEGINGSPTVIHPPRNDSEDTIFQSVMIHSDSFLKKCYSSLALTQANLDSFLQSCSDVKFYPGRVTSTDKPQNPFVKFMLTPTQNANAGLPPNQVQIVDKKPPEKDAVIEFYNKERPESTSSGINDQISLPSIECFIKKLSRGKKKANPKPDDHKKAQPAASKISQKKNNIPCDHSKAAGRKPYHECQKRKLIDKAKVAEKKIKMADSKTKLNKEQPQQGPEPENSDSLQFLKKFILSLSQVMESFSTGTSKNAKSPESDPATEGMSADGPLEKATNTTLGTKTSRITLSDSAADILPKRVESVKNAVTQTEDLPYATGRTEGDYEGEVGKQTMGDNASCALASAIPPRKSKTLKIKIHCDDRSRESNKAGRTWQQEVENPVEEEPQKLNEKLGLLDSLVAGDPNGISLERRSSIYYDAVETQLNEESETDSAKGRTDSSQKEFLTHWATVESAHLNAESLGKEKSCGDSSRILSNVLLPEMSSDSLFDEILKSLQEDKICRSLTLLDDFLGRTEFSKSWNKNSDKLRSVLLLVCSRSINLMIGMEKKAWLKVLSLLEDISQKFGGDEENSPEDSQKALIGKIRNINDSRLVDLQNYCISLSQTAIGSSSRAKKFFTRIKNSFAYLTNRIAPQRSHSANSIQSTAEATLHSGDQLDRNPLHHLREQIQKHKSYIEFLLSTDCGIFPQEVQDVEEKVAEKMKTVGSIISLVSEE